jgi:hypothetical protein
MRSPRQSFDDHGQGAKIAELRTRLHVAVVEQFQRLRSSLEQRLDGLSVSSSVSGEWDDEAEEYELVTDPDDNLYSVVFKQCFTLDSQAISVSPSESFEGFLTKAEASSHPWRRRDVCITTSFELVRTQLQYKTEVTRSRNGQLAVGPNGRIDLSDYIIRDQEMVALDDVLDEIGNFIASSEPIIAGGLHDHSEP